MKKDYILSIVFAVIFSLIMALCIVCMCLIAREDIAASIVLIVPTGMSGVLVALSTYTAIGAGKEYKRHKELQKSFEDELKEVKFTICNEKAPEAVYICDRRKCSDCRPWCTHTFDITHAKNFKDCGGGFYQNRLRGKFPAGEIQHLQKQSRRPGSPRSDTSHRCPPHSGISCLPA